jgi:hypothetical protein
MTSRPHKTLPSVVAACAGLTLAPAAFTHHSSSMYDRTKPVTMEAEVVEFQWVNPHAHVVVVPAKPTAGGERKTWSVELTSPGVLTRNGWSKRTFNPGDRVTLQFAPLRNGDPGGYFLQATLADGTVMTYNLEQIE